MIKYHECSMCGKITHNFNDAVNHALSHATVTRSYAASKGFYVCPVCNTCHNTEKDMKTCVNAHVLCLKELGYI